MHEQGGYNLVSRGCGVLFFAALAMLFGLGIGTPAVIAAMLFR